MNAQVRRLGAALALGFAGGVAAPVVVYVSLSHLGAPRAESRRPVQNLPLEMEPSTPPAFPVAAPAPAPAAAAKPARHASRARPAAAPAPVVPRASPADLGRHVPSVPDAPQP